MRHEWTTSEVACFAQAREVRGRLSQRLSQAKTARALNISRSAVQRIELEALAKVCWALRHEREELG